MHWLQVELLIVGFKRPTDGDMGMLNWTKCAPSIKRENKKKRNGTKEWINKRMKERNKVRKNERTKERTKERKKERKNERMK